ncbi:MAG: dihydroorotate dehydrogenase electron transfer subunit, partial [Oscillospiraceae bacterium]
LGFRTQTMAYALDDFAACGAMQLCTDDGSAGTPGTVLDAMRARLLTDGERPGRIMACGPAPMLRAVQDFCREQKIPGQLSLEQRMGCGYGACLTCACAVKKEDGSIGYDRVCADGPVFDAEEVVL